MKKLLPLTLVALMSGCSAPVKMPTTTMSALTRAEAGKSGQARALVREQSLYATGHNIQSTNAASGEAMAASVSPDSDDLKLRLQTCLFEAKQLSRLGNSAYKAQVAALYHNIQATQYYASIARELARTTTDTITPLYQFKVNDACNTISQSLLAELKKGASLPERAR